MSSLAILLAASIQSQLLDAHFIADRVLVDAPLAHGGHLRFWTDSGGGGTILYPAAVARLGLKAVPLTGSGAEELGPGAARLVEPLELRASTFPQPPLPIAVAQDVLARMGEQTNTDGNVGQNWFAGHIWTWDYPRGTLAIEPDNWKPPRGAHIIPVGFRSAQGGGDALHFPRITVTIAGVETPVLLDTGATTVLTPEAEKIVGGPRLRATSMIVAGRIARWRQEHPDWPVIEHGQGGTGSLMIRVPDVRVAGYQVGPIWFTSRPDDNFHKDMASSMAGPIEGAIGGNAFHTLTMTVDYLQGRAAFFR